MTDHDRARLLIRLDRARERAEDAAYHGDHAGAVIAAGDARRILRRLTADAHIRSDRNAA